MAALNAPLMQVQGAHSRFWVTPLAGQPDETILADNTGGAGWIGDEKPRDNKERHLRSCINVSRYEQGVLL